MTLKPTQGPSDLEHGASLLCRNEILSPARWVRVKIGNNIAKDLEASVEHSARVIDCGLCYHPGSL